MSDYRDVAAWCEQTETSAFPCPRGVAYTVKNAVELNAVFAVETYEAWRKNLFAYLSGQAA